MSPVYVSRYLPGSPNVLVLDLLDVQTCIQASQSILCLIILSECVPEINVSNVYVFLILFISIDMPLVLPFVIHFFALICSALFSTLLSYFAFPCFLLLIHLQSLETSCSGALRKEEFQGKNHSRISFPFTASLEESVKGNLLSFL